jgi:hypothetical protein
VLVECQNGPAVRIEIKAQLTLSDFSWIQSADWVREETDFLGELLATEPTARDRLSTDVRELIVGSYAKEAGWDLGALWVADIAGVTNRRTRRRLGLLTPGHMTSFLENKYLVHLTMEGLRLFRLSEIPNLLSALKGGLRYKLMPPLNASELRVRTRGDGQAPRHGGIHLTYFLGQRNRPVGGHHMHAPFFDGAEPLLLKGLGARRVGGTR